jgi:ABC-type Fe3+ transport system permease subunit
MILPVPGKRWLEKILLGVSHLVNTAGIALATYGGSPSPTGGVINETANKIGNCLELFVLAGICCCICISYVRIRPFRGDAVHRRALRMLWLVASAMPWQMIRLAYTTTYAFSPIPSLDPVMGSFATKLILIFGTQLATGLALVAGGWLGLPPKAKSDRFIGLERQTTYETEGGHSTTGGLE